jgi:hypothetical protein
VCFSIRANDHIFIFACSERVEPYHRAGLSLRQVIPPTLVGLMTELAALAAFGFPLETALEGGMVISTADAALLFAS